MTTSEAAQWVDDEVGALFDNYGGSYLEQAQWLANRLKSGTAHDHELSYADHRAILQVLTTLTG